VVITARANPMVLRQFDVVNNVGATRALLEQALGDVTFLLSLRLD